MEILKQIIVEVCSYSNIQWGTSYPQEKDFMNGIKEGDLFVVESEGRLAGFVCENKVEPIEYNGLNWS